MSIKHSHTNCSSLQADHKVYRLFVTGLSKDTSLQSIQGYFATFGYIQVRLLRKDNSRPGNSYGSCCLLATNSQTVSKNIIAHREHYLEGRLLHVSVFLEGEALQAHNDKINKRRIVVKGIPPNLLLDVLKQNLEDRFGKIESVYYFKQSPTSRGPRSSCCSGRLLTASVVFCRSHSARQATLAGKVHITGYLMTVQEFQRGFNKSVKNSSEKTDANSDGSERSHNDQTDHSHRKIPDKGGKQLAARSKALPCNLSIKTETACGEQLSVLHLMKPSTKSYFQCRQAASFTTGSNWQAEYKYNLSRQM